MPKLRVVLFALLLALLPSARAADGSSEMDTEVRRLLELTGAANLGASMARNVIASLKTSLPKVPEEFWTEFQRDIRPGDVAELVIPIYARHLTLAEVRAANVFYSTPEGRSMVQKLPVIMSDAMQAGQKWGEQLAQRAIERLKEKGLVPKQG